MVDPEHSSHVTRLQFGAIQPKIVAAHAALLNSRFGREHLQLRSFDSASSYDNFIRVKPLSGEEIGADGFAALLYEPPGSDPLVGYTTTGTRGTPRSVHWPKNTTADVSSLRLWLDESARVTATYTAAVVETDIFLDVHLRGLRTTLPHIAIAAFGRVYDVAEIIQRSDAIVLTDYPSALARFVRLANVALEMGLLKEDQVRGKRLIARLTGEPMTAMDLEYWHHSATRIGLEAHIELRYGCTELLGIGKSQFEPGTSVVEYKLTNQECFFEVLDIGTLQPLYEGTGMVCATSFRTVGTVLFRYLLGDIVDIFERDGGRYVRNIRRPDALMVTGNTISLADFVVQVRTSLEMEICLEVRKRVDRQSGVQSVMVKVFVPSEDREVHESVRLQVEQRFVDDLKIRPAIEDGLVTVKITSERLVNVGERRRKAWKLS